MTSPRIATVLLRELEGLKQAYGDAAAGRKLEVLRALERTPLPTARQVRSLHDLLCYWRAYPESRALLEQVELMLVTFERRADLRRHRRALQDSGIAGTELRFRFFWPMALRIAERWPERVRIDWKAFAKAGELEELLHLLLPYSETPGLDAIAQPARRWLQILRRHDETDATFLIRRFRSLRTSAEIREHLYDNLRVPIRLAAGADTPARTREKWVAAAVVFQKRPPRRGRPQLRRLVRDATFRIQSLPPREARRMIDLANDCMVPRHRDLLVFLHGDENDVRLLDFGDGLQFACIGAVPERRLLLEAVYGFLTLRNGVPIGYLLNSALFGSCELAYNVFETFRGVETARTYGRFMTVVQHLFGADSFTIDPYQLGHGNPEGLASGAWWFYYKLGFRPRDFAVRALVREERRAIDRDPSHQTSVARLRRLAADNLFFSLQRPRADVLGRISLGEIGLRISRYLAGRFGSDRERAVRACSREAARLLEVRDPRRLPPGERVAWERWSPLVLTLPGIESWGREERRALARVVRAKGGQRESDFVRLFDRHTKLRRAVLELADER